MNQNSGRAKTEPEIQQAYEHNQTIIKSFIISYETNRDVFKKLGSAISIFAEHLDEISKQKIPQTDQPLTQFSNKLSQIFKDMNYQIKCLGSVVIGVYSYFKDALQPIKQFKTECKTTYNDHVKLFNQVKKEYEQSNQKVADIQQKLQLYTKSIRPIATQDTQSYDFLKHQEEMAKNEQKIRFYNKKEYLLQLSTFIDKQQKQTQAKFAQYYKLVNDQAIHSFTQFNLTFNQLIDVNKFTDTSTSFISTKSFKQVSRSKSPSYINNSNQIQQVSHRSKSPKPYQQIIQSEMIDELSSINNKSTLVDRTNNTSRTNSRVDLPCKTNRSNNSFFSDKPSFKTAQQCPKYIKKSQNNFENDEYF